MVSFPVCRLIKFPFHVFVIKAVSFRKGWVVQCGYLAPCNVDFQHFLSIRQHSPWVVAGFFQQGQSQLLPRRLGAAVSVNYPATCFTGQAMELTKVFSGPCHIFVESKCTSSRVGRRMLIFPMGVMFPGPAASPRLRIFLGNPKADPFVGQHARHRYCLDAPWEAFLVLTALERHS